MVESKYKKHLTFWAFVMPCLILYLIFFITPFLQGIRISFTNWDGLTPKSPIVVSKTEFDQNILAKLSNENDRNYLKEIYKYEKKDDSYHRLALKQKDRKKVERIFRRAKWEPAGNRFVGFENYKKIFSGKTAKDFYPHHYTIKKYDASTKLPAKISKKEFESELLKKCSEEDKNVLLHAYKISGDKYKINQHYNETDVDNKIWKLPEVAGGTAAKPSAFLKELKTAISSGKEHEVSKIAEKYIKENNLSKNSILTINSWVKDYEKIYQVKKLMDSTWILKKFNMGVIGFTLFFAFFSVIGINLVAFGLALALDSGIKGQKWMRSAFFIPNVLSMVIVALIWSMLFVQLLPAVTGVEKWLSDSNKTPWLLVLVSIWQGAGYYMIIYLAGLQNIPGELIEAAKIDGASWGHRFKYITLPLLAPSFTISLFLSIANALKSFDLIYAMIGQSGYAYGTVPFVMDIYFDAYSQKQAGLATAKAMVLFLIIFAISGIQLAISKRKEIEQ